MPLQPVRCDTIMADRDRLVRQMAGMFMVPKEVLTGTRGGGMDLYTESFFRFQKQLAEGFESMATRMCRQLTEQFWAAETKRKHKADIADAMTRWAESLRDGKPHELSGVAVYVRELVFDHPEAEWTARLSILADYLRDTVEGGYEAGELLGELLAEGFTLVEVSP